MKSLASQSSVMSAKGKTRTGDRWHRAPQRRQPYFSQGLRRVKTGLPIGSIQKIVAWSTGDLGRVKTKPQIQRLCESRQGKSLLNGSFQN